MAYIYITAFLLPLVLALFFTPQVIRFAIYINAMDAPGGRKIHKNLTPRLGGLSVFASIVISLGAIYLFHPSIFEGAIEHPVPLIIIGGSFLGIFLLGFWDDLAPLKPGVKFGIQFIIAALVYFAGFEISNITNPVGSGMLDVEMLNFPLTVLWLVGITNAFNLIDGLDGLASGVATIASISIFTVSALAGDTWTAILALALAGSLVGFLRFNFSPASIFLGDSGSLIIGFSLALLSIHSTTKISTGFALLFPMLVLGLPITDTLVSMLRRFLGSFMLEKKEDVSASLTGKLYRMFTPDRSHIHHQLLSLGLTQRNTVLLLYFVSAFFALGAFIVTRVDTLEKIIAISLIFGIAIILGLKKLQYREIAILNNGIMLPVYERWILNKGIFLSLIDLTFIVISYSLSYWLIKNIQPPSTAFFNFELGLIIVLTVQLFTFWISGIYQKTLKQLGIGNVIRISASVVYACIAAAVVLFVSDNLPMPSGIHFLIFDFYLILSFTLGIRIAYQALSYWFHRGKTNAKNVLIYGANENGTMILHKLNHSPYSNFKVLGFLDDNPEMEGKLIYGYPIIGGHWKLSKTIKESQVDFIFICENDMKTENFNRLKKKAKAHNIKIKRLYIRLKPLTTSDSTNGEAIFQSTNSKTSHLEPE